METQSLYESSALLVATTGVAASSFVDVTYFNKLILSKKSTGGTYVFEIDWSNDGVTADVTETVTVPEGDQVDQPIANKYALFRVKNTGGTPFTVHKTSVTGQIGT